MNEQNISLKFCFKLGKTPKGTYATLVRVYEDQALFMKCAYEWFARFREGRKSVSDNTRSRRLVTSMSDENIEKVRKSITKNCQLTVSMIAEEPQINCKSVRQIVTQNLGMNEARKKQGSTHLISLLADFVANDLSAAGVSHVVKAPSPYRRGFWFLIVILTAMGMSYMTYRVLQEYLAYPTVMRSKILDFRSGSYGPLRILVTAEMVLDKLKLIWRYVRYLNSRKLHASELLASLLRFSLTPHQVGQRLQQCHKILRNWPRSQEVTICERLPSGPPTEDRSYVPSHEALDDAYQHIRDLE
ncbi:protein GVQW3 [Trichonephila clavipes]|uniref:Protein GVQW3 n=1 Tax=Trichonephila clavipes TaxID=2585209 RepID=A0A8X6VAM8_TRICX|nr:protein GVQW3 [Trichonephila clavipes]